MIAAVDVRALVAGIPHDGPAVFLYALLLGCFVLVWRANRSRGAPPEAGDDNPPNPSNERPR